MYLSALAGTLFLLSQAGGPLPAIDSETCLSCHTEAGLSVTLRDGASLSLQVARDALTHSVHAKAACVDCHTGQAEIPHAERTFASRRDVTLALDAQCRRCHFSNYTKTLDSVHQQSVARGDRMAPVCVDCHGSHDIRKPSTPRVLAAQTCAKCHAGVAVAYARSAHGRALTEGNADVPICSDCHRAHDVGGPRQTAWELRTPEMCGSCHANAALMKKYGLSANVLSTYLADFHGKTAALRRHQGTPVTGAVVARCTDCHGVHDIQKTRDPQSPVIKANLLATCRQCHADATDNFPAAWLSHYEPSLQKAPLVYAVKIGYAVIIPFMIGGLGLQVLLHFWRLMANR
jgi:nitrate/TMAO reductase-like tetraheme cytochrome c subunit